MPSRLIDIRDLSEQLKVPEKTIRNKLSDGKWPLHPIRIGRCLRWRQSDVDAYIEDLVETSRRLAAGIDEAFR
ncbi:MAG: excisionase [Hyphomicrobiales bacterium]|nr:MAG: excisionase [Hyphomicrobiales bacterium]